MDILTWWMVSVCVLCFVMFVILLRSILLSIQCYLLVACNIYGIPAFFVLCEQLFSASAEIATDQCLRLGSDHLSYKSWNMCGITQLLTMLHNSDSVFIEYKDFHKI